MDMFFKTVGSTLSNAVVKQCDFHNDTEYEVLVIDHDGTRTLSPGEIEGNWLFSGFSVDLEMKFSHNVTRRITFPASRFDNMTHRISKLFEDHIQEYKRGHQQSAERTEMSAAAGLSEHELTRITEKLTPYSHTWKRIGQALGFTAHELSNIEAQPYLFMGGTSSYLSAMMSAWGQWTPGDTRGSTDYASLESLRTAVDRAGLGRLAQEL